MYATVPASSFLVDRYVLYLHRARPKSEILALPDVDISTLPGFRSLKMWGEVWTRAQK